MKVNLMKVNCPTCSNATEWRSDNQYRPFCSERCKLVDLGEWASETRVIKGEAQKPPQTVDMAELARQLEDLEEMDTQANSFFLPE